MSAEKDWGKISRNLTEWVILSESLAKRERKLVKILDDQKLNGPSRTKANALLNQTRKAKKEASLECKRLHKELELLKVEIVSTTSRSVQKEASIVSVAHLQNIWDQIRTEDMEAQTA